MKIAVIGAGAMGNLFGAYLSKKNEVYMIDVNKSVVDSINENGLNIYEIDIHKTVNYKVPAKYDSSQLGEMDLVIMFVKNIYNISALENNKNLFGHDTLVMTLQNGAGNDRDLAQFVKKENIFIGTTEHNCLNKGNGHIEHNSAGVTNIGMLEFDHAKVLAIVETFGKCGFKTQIYENIQEIIWRKLFINISLNPVTAILRCKAGYLDENQFASNIVNHILSEAVEVANADGRDFDKSEIISHVKEQISGQFAGILTSMNQDITNRRLTEIDYINGAVVLAAKEYGIPTPYNEMIVNLVHATEGLY